MFYVQILQIEPNGLDAPGVDSRLEVGGRIALG